MSRRARTCRGERCRASLIDVKGRVGLVAALIVGVATSPAPAAMLPSTSFNHQYNGDTAPNANGYTHNPGPEPTWMPTTDGDIMSYQGEIDLGGYWQSDDWVAGPDAASNANGWTIEFRMKVGTDAPGDSTFGVFQLFAKDVNGNNSQGRRLIVQIFPNKTRLASRALDVDANSNTDDFHIFRFGQNPSSNGMVLWRDGAQIFSGASQSSNDSSSSVAQMWWGDGTSGNGSTDLNPTVYIDYVRWDNRGLFEPVPEPSAVALAAVGLVACCGCFRRTWRKK